MALTRKEAIEKIQKDKLQSMSKSIELGCSFELVEYIESLEERLSKLERDFLLSNAVY